LNVAIIKTDSVYTLNGPNNFIYVLSEALIKLGCKVTIIGGFGLGDPIKIREYFDVEKIPFIITLSSRKELKGIKKRVLWLSKGLRIIGHISPNLIITNAYMPIPLPPIGIRILRFHDVPKGFLNRIITKLCAPLYNTIVVSSHELKMEFISNLKIPPDKCEAIPLPIDLGKYRSLPACSREHAILYVNHRKRRNLSIALKAFSLLRRRDRGMKMYVVGVKKPRWIKNSDGIIWLGTVSRQYLRDLYSKVKVLLFPSSYEGYGYPVLEALASGTPVVGSASLPRSLLIDGYNGFRVPSFNAEHYAIKILKLLRDNELWDNMREKSLTVAKRHDSLIIAKRYLELYAQHISSQSAVDKV